MKIRAKFIIRLKTKVYRIRMKITPKPEYITRMKIRPTFIVFSIRMKIRSNTIVYRIRMKIRSKTRVYSKERKLNQEPECIVFR